MIFTLTCPLCPEEFKSHRLGAAQEALRFHKEQRHLDAKVETDT